MFSVVYSQPEHASKHVPPKTRFAGTEPHVETAPPRVPLENTQRQIKVYVLKRGNSTETASQDIHNRGLWRVGTVTAAANGRFTVQYNGEEGKPKESRIVAARIRARNVIRQKAIQRVTKPFQALRSM